MRNEILGWVFKDYKRGLDENLMLEKRVFKATGDVKDIVRERLKGIRPGHPDENSNWLAVHISNMEKPERLEFLSKAHTILKDTTFKVVMEYLMTEAMRKATLEAGDIVDVNFQRATVNGLMLLEEELSNLSSTYLEEKKLQELITIEESYEVV